MPHPKPRGREYRKIGDDEFGWSRVLVVYLNGVAGHVIRWTGACSGCFEFNEGWGLSRYEWDSKAECFLGFGCEECGYSGKRRQEQWIPFEHEGWEQAIASCSDGARGDAGSTQTEGRLPGMSSDSGQTL